MGQLPSNKNDQHVLQFGQFDMLRSVKINAASFMKAFHYCRQNRSNCIFKWGCHFRFACIVFSWSAAIFLLLFSLCHCWLPVTNRLLELTVTVTREVDLNHSPDELTQYVGDGLTNRVFCKTVGVPPKRCTSNKPFGLSLHRKLCNHNKSQNCKGAHPHFHSVKPYCAKQ